MTPSSFTKGEVALLDPSLSPSRGSAGVMQGVSRARGDVEGRNGEINLEEKERHWCSDRGRRIGGKVRQSQIEPDRVVDIKKKPKKRREQNESVRFDNNISKITLVVNPRQVRFKGQTEKWEICPRTDDNTSHLAFSGIPDRNISLLHCTPFYF